MAQPNHDPITATPADAGAVLGTYLRAQATAFLRALRLHDEGTASGAAEGSEAARSLRGLRAASADPWPPSGW